MTRVLAGILGDLGAEVIKIEHPIRGDDTRAWGPPYATYNEESGKQGPGESAYFLGVNRNKKSLGLSFQHKSGVEILHKLAEECDVLVENYLPGALKKYDMDYDTLAKINPGLIYASITGYGQTGPYSSRAGYDVMVEAEMGLMHITGHRDGPPAKVGVAITDLTTGLYTSNSVMAALLGRAKTGRGQHLDVSLADCQVASLANIASSCLISGKADTGRWGTAHPSIVPYKGFQTKDGSVMLGGGNDRLYGVMCDKLGRPEWIKDPRFVTNADRVKHRDELEELVETVTRTKTTQEWLDVLEGSGMPYAAINDIQGTLQHEHKGDDCANDYEALSYCWGDVRRHQRLIEIDGRAFPVGENLQGALQNLRRSDRPRLLWIDAICINQRDAEERNEQVRMMLEIYGAAKEVVAWLGPSTQHTSIGMSLLVDIKNGRREGEEPSWTALPPQLVKDGLMDIAARQYFTRLWVVQETAIAKRVILACGQYSITWENKITEALRFLRSLKAASLSPEWRVSDMKVDLSPLINLLQMQLDTGPQYAVWEETRPLPDLLEIAYDTRHRKTSDMRDQLYALVTLLYRRRPSLASEFKIDYTMSVEETYEQLQTTVQNSDLSRGHEVSRNNLCSQDNLQQKVNEAVVSAASMRDDAQIEGEELVPSSHKTVNSTRGEVLRTDQFEALDRAKEFLTENHVAEAAEQLEQLAFSLRNLSCEKSVA
ncbi:hypothetical protein D0867_05162 [Hortaea werneckii]|uniref:Heterokaryon incompatibility domain-containing protein n=1 Tax=Hortaea werneckii TaxID=91943 RepID=A0A3M6ZTW3_HORWE|nr:hypothetical protein D0867_05162 [Hortaea werneckii]